MAQSAHGDLHIMNNELMTSWVYNNVIGLWYHMGYLFQNGFVCIVRRCKLLNPENISGYHQINKIGEFLQFSSKRKGIRAWNFRMMIRKIWQFLWYQNRNNSDRLQNSEAIDEPSWVNIFCYQHMPGPGPDFFFLENQDKCHNRHLIKSGQLALLAGTVCCCVGTIHVSQLLACLLLVAFTRKIRAMNLSSGWFCYKS